MGVGGDREHSKRAVNLGVILKITQNGKSQAGNALISSFLQPSPGGQGPEQRHFNSQAGGQGSLREAIHSDYSYRSHKKQVKEAIPTQSQNWLFPAIARVIVPGNRGLGMTS